MSQPDAASPRCRAVGDRGAGIVEAAFALPILMLVVLSLIDFSLAQLRYSDATSAARDGARVAMLGRSITTTGPQTSCNPTPADAAFTKVCNAVKARMTSVDVSSVEVRCYSGIGASASPAACTSSSVKPDQSSVEVIVTWTLTPVTMVGQTFIGSRTVTTSARMVIVN